MVEQELTARGREALDELHRAFVSLTLRLEALASRTRDLGPRDS